MPTTIPQGIDDPPQILFWKATELMPVMLGLVAGMILDRATIMTAIGVGFVYVYRRACESRPDGAFLHFAYWWGLIPLSARTLPNPFCRVWLP